MKESIVGFLTVAGAAAWLLCRHQFLLMPLLLVGGALLAVFLVAFVVWYGFVQIRIFFRF